MNALLNEKAIQTYVAVNTRLHSLKAKIQNERGIESVEWIALAAVILVFLVAMMAILKPAGTVAGTGIGAQIGRWILKWSPS